MQHRCGGNFVLQIQIAIVNSGLVANTQLFLSSRSCGNLRAGSQRNSG